MNDIQAMLTLPFETLLILVSGYLGYRVAYTGKDRTHGPVDIVFLTLVYAFIAKLVFAELRPLAGDLTAILAVGASLCSAAIWRLGGENLVFKILRGARISTSDRHWTAWDTVRMKPNFEPKTLVLRLTDGRRLMCGDLGRFSDFEAGPCVFGSDGSVALFVTDQSEPGSQEWQERSLVCDGFGTEMTFVPAAQIAEIKVFLPR